MTTNAKPQAAITDVFTIFLGVAGIVGVILLGWYRQPSYFFRDDFVNQYIPGYVEIVRALEAGEFPLLTPYSWHAGALAGEYQYGLFSPFHLGVLWSLFQFDLELITAGYLLFGLHLIIAFVGAYVLARNYGLDRPGSLLAGWAGSINGWHLGFGSTWIPVLTSFCWIPWFWWLARKCLQSERPWRWVVPAAIVGQFIVAAGWPFTAIMMYLVLGLAFVQSFGDRRWKRARWPLVAIGLFALLLSAPAWLMLVEYSRWSLRAEAIELIWGFRILIPGWFSATMPLPTNPEEPIGYALHVGWAPIVLVLWGLVFHRKELTRELGAEIFFLVLLFLLASMPSVRPFRFSFRWLPLIYLTLGLLAGKAWMHFRDSPPRWPTHPAIFAGTIAVLGTLVLHGSRNEWDGAFLYGMLSAVAALAWFLVDRMFHRFGVGENVAGCVVFLTTTAILVATYQTNWGHHFIYPEDVLSQKGLERDRLYLGLYYFSEFDVGRIHQTGPYGPGNQLFLSRIRAINGYSPMEPAGTKGMFDMEFAGYLAPRPTIFPNGFPPGPAFKRLAVDGVILSKKFVPKDFPFEDFEQVADSERVVILHRKGERTPLVQSHAEARFVWQPRGAWAAMDADDSRPFLERWNLDGKSQMAYDRAEVRLLENSRHRARVFVDATSAKEDALVSIARPWFPGYSATYRGQPIDVLRLDTLMPAFLIPPGTQGEIVLEYFPKSLRIGLWLAGAGVFGLGVVVFATRRLAATR